jgi:hypothetical protein
VNNCGTKEKWEGMFGPDVGMGSVGAASIGTTSLTLGSTTCVSTFNGMKGWMDIPNSVFRNFNEFFKLIPVVIPSFATGKYNIQWRCHAESYGSPVGFSGCDIFLFIYHCPPCTFNDGDIGQKLLTSSEADFKLGTCAPKFNLDHTNANAMDHPFGAYMAEIEDGAEVTITTGDRTDFLFWGQVGKDVICSHKLTDVDCAAVPLSCVWDGDSCEPRQCPPRTSMYWGGSPRCTYCISDELGLLPDVI